MTFPVCYQGIYLWDGEYDNNCILRKDHPPNLHYDGVSWFGENENGEVWFKDDDVDEGTERYILSIYGPPRNDWTAPEEWFS